MESVAPAEPESTESEAVSSVMQSGTSALFEDVEANKLNALQELKKNLPALEATSEDVRRCTGVIIENFHAANRLLLAAEKTGILDLALLEFRYAISEIGNNLDGLLSSAQQVEIATNEIVKGAQELAAKAVQDLAAKT